MIGIYKITNKQNGRVYVGKSIDIDTRKYQHISELRNGEHPNDKLQSDFDKFGENSFDFDICEIVEDESKLEYLEDYYIKMYDCIETGYNQKLSNLHLTENANRKGIVFSFRTSKYKASFYKAYAEAAGIKIGEFCNMAIDDYMKRNELTGDSKAIFRLKMKMSE